MIACACRRPRAVGRAVAITLATCLLLAGCAGSVDPYRQAVDDLQLPAAWQTAKTVARGTGGETGCAMLADPLCPSVTRYYSAPGELTAVHDEARAAADEGGFAVIEDTSPRCDRNTNAARCSIIATKGGVRLEIFIFGPGEDPDRVGVGIPDQATVRVVALPL